MIRLIFAVAIFWATLFPAAASAEESGYRYCTATGKSVALTRTLRTDGSFALQTSRGGGIAIRRSGGLRAYLVWLRSPADAPLLRVAYTMWEDKKSIYLPNGAPLVLIGPDKGEYVAAGKGIQKADFALYDFDPQAVLERFPGVREVELRFRKPGGSGTILKAAIDLDALRAALADIAALDPATAACTADSAGLTDDINVAAFTMCQIQLTDPTGSYWSSGDRVTWQFRASPNLTISAERVTYSGETSAEFAASLDRPFGVRHPYMLSLTPYEKLYNRIDLTAVLTAGADSVEMRPGWSITPAWAKLNKPGVPVTIELHDKAGRVVERTILPAGLLSAVEAQLIAISQKLRDMARDPMTFCEPMGMIVVT